MISCPFPLRSASTIPVPIEPPVRAASRCASRFALECSFRLASGFLSLGAVVPSSSPSLLRCALYCGGGARQHSYRAAMVFLESPDGPKTPGGTARPLPLSLIVAVSRSLRASSRMKRARVRATSPCSLQPLSPSRKVPSALFGVGLVSLALPSSFSTPWSFFSSSPAGCVS